MGAFTEDTEKYNESTGWYTLTQFNAKTGMKYVERINERTSYRITEQWDQIRNTRHLFVVRPFNFVEWKIIGFSLLIQRLVPNVNARGWVYKIGIGIVFQLFLLVLTEFLSLFDINICVTFFCESADKFYMFLFGIILIMAIVFEIIWVVFKHKYPKAYLRLQVSLLFVFYSTVV